MTGAAGLRVEAEGVTKTFGPVRALRGVDLTIEPGEIHALLGENGAGKSTLVRMLAGDESPDHGRILLDGEQVDISSPIRSRELDIAIVHQELSLFPNLTIAENLYADRLPVRRLGTLDRRRLRRQARELLAEFGLESAALTPVGSLSVARRQVVEILKAVGRRCRLLVFDEPTSALTGEEVARLFELIGDLKRQGVTIVYITHKLPEVFGIADRASVLRDGVCVGTVRMDDATPDDLIAMMVGREITNILARADERPLGEPVLRVESLNRGSRVRDVSFEARAGEIVGIAGVVGSGRSELLRAVFGIDPPRSGTISVDGKRLKPGLPHLAIAAGVGFVPEDRKTQGLFLGMSVRDNVIAARRRDHQRRGLRSVSAERATTSRMVSSLGIKTPGPEQIVGRLSGGNQQKVLLARWLTERPKVLLVDEPTRGIDVGARAEIYEVLRDLARSGVTIVMVSSELPELLGLADRVLVMREGRLIEELAAADASEEAVIRAATGGAPLGEGGTDE